MQDLVDITEYLHEMEKSQIHQLGLFLGLSHTKLNKMDPSTFLEDVIAAWLHQDDWVKMRGEPSWMVLINALKLPRVGQTGIAAKIAKDRGLQHNSGSCHSAQQLLTSSL